MAELALRGGKKTFSGFWPAWPVYGEEDEQALVDVLRSRNWGGYPAPNQRAREFAAAFAAAHDARYGICAANGTVTLEVALRACGVKAGDEVIVTPYTWIATAGAPVTVNAVPVFADVDPDTYCLDPAAVEAAVCERSRAIIAVHLGGSLADLDALVEIADKHDLVLIEDCAHMHGAKWRGKGVGSHGQLGSFSFQSSKLMTAGEGGIILTSDEELEQRCQSHVNCGRKEPGYDRFEGLVFSGNYRMTEFQAALLQVRLGHLERERVLRQAHAEYLDGLLAEVDGVRPMARDERTTHPACYQYIFRYDPEAFGGASRDRFVEALCAEGVPADGDFYVPIYRSPLFPITADRFPAIRERYGERIDPERIDCPVAEKAAYREAVWLHHPLLMADKAEIDAIAEAIRKIAEHADELRE
ncbi:MAG: aminotransferase class I/II-fold pyridoxal phosphate-dependent enzyme [Deltaproteobacteria bacterium]|nr:aminotransferase class I/II-fold pyridoxal phosphate-dependent enzyme [Deltaproteobacteria bacterium]